MSQQNLLKSAKQGHPIAIAHLINQATQMHGISVRVARQGQHLHFLVESERLANPQRMVAFIRQVLQDLATESIATAKVYGRRVGERAVAWQETVTLTPTATIDPDLLEAPQEPRLTEVERSRGVALPLEPAAPIPVSGEALVTPNFPKIKSDTELDDDRSEADWISLPTVAPAASSLHAFGRERPGVGMENSVAAPAFPQVPPIAIAPPDRLPVPPYPMDHPIESNVSAQPDGHETAPLELEEQGFFSPDAQKLLQRPEALLLIVFALMIVLWESYLEFLEEDVPQGTFSGRRLAQRLGVSPDTLRRKREIETFSHWSKSLDPDGIAWVYQQGAYTPIVRKSV